MFRKIIAVLLLILGIACAVYGYHIYSHPVSLGSCTDIQDGFYSADNEGRYVLVRGELSCHNGAHDDLFNLQTGSLLLIRTVEIYTGSGGFVSDTDPAFSGTLPDGLKSEVFFADRLTIGCGELDISPEYVSKLALDRYTDLSRVYPLADLTDLPYRDLSSLGLISYKGFYGTSGDSWKEGDIRVSYKVLDYSYLGEFTVTGKQSGKMIVPDGDFGSIYDTEISAEDLFPSLSGAVRTVFTILEASGLLLILISVFLLLSARKKS